MELIFVIKDGYWREVSREEYDNFKGNKFIAPPSWRRFLVMDWLLQLRNE